MNARHKLERRNFLGAQTQERNILKGKNLKAQTKRLTQLKRQFSQGNVNKQELNKFIAGINRSKKLNSFQKAQILGSLTHKKKNNDFTEKIADEITKNLSKITRKDLGDGLMPAVVKDQLAFLERMAKELYEKVAPELRRAEKDSIAVRQFFKMRNTLGKIGIW